MKSILILAPWWHHEAHVGNLRLRRHVAWLKQAGYRVILVDSGLHYSLNEDDGLTRITIPDPLKMHVAPTENAAPPRKPNALRRWLAYALLLPDPSIVWARRVLAHPVVRHSARTCAAVMSSSPPEAAFLACAALSKRYGMPFWMDMRDGWLDEPLKPLLRTSAIQRWRERALESQCLAQATVVTVTSDQWAEMLLHRYPEHRSKVRVVTNAAPASVGRKLTGTDSRTLLYAGRLTSSRPERDLIDLDLTVKRLQTFQFSVMGDLTPDERNEAMRLGWAVREALPRREMLQSLAAASGLVLLSGSQGSIPAKFFDYLATGRPILGIAPRGSAAWEALTNTPQGFAVDVNEPVGSAFSEFANATAQTEPWPIPDEFSEEAVRSRFMEVLSCL